MALCYDDVGDAEGTPVVYLHGTPDSRLARHPDDVLAAAAGVRLLAVDRPGYGGSAADESLAGGLVELLDNLRIDECVMLAWSGGAVAALHALRAQFLLERTRQICIVAGLVPRDAFDLPKIRRAAPERLDFMRIADAMSPEEFAATMAPLLAPYPCDLALALEHQMESRNEADRRALAEVPGATERLADALVEGVRGGLEGVEADLHMQVARFVRNPLPMPETLLVYGTHDTVTPPDFALWYLQREEFPSVEEYRIEGAGHFLPFTHWTAILDLL